MALAARTERASRGHDDAFLQEAQSVRLVVPAGHAHPQVEARVRGQVLEAHPLEEILEELALLPEDPAPLLDVLVAVPGGYRRVLHEGLGGEADGGPQLLEGGDKFRISCHHRRAVAGHAAALAEGAEGERALAGYL